MQIIVKSIQKAKKTCKPGRKAMRFMKKNAHRKFRHRAKQAVYMGKEIDMKPCLTAWNIV